MGVLTDGETKVNDDASEEAAVSGAEEMEMPEEAAVSGAEETEALEGTTAEKTEVPKETVEGAEEAEAPEEKTPVIEEKFLLDLEQEVYVDKSVFEQHASKKKAKKILKLSLITVFAVIAAAYLGISVWFTFHFNRNTYIDGYDVSFQAVKEVEADIEARKDDYKLELLLRNGVSQTVNQKDAGMSVAVSFGAKAMKKKQNGFLWFLYIDDQKKEYTTKYEVTVDRAVLKNFVSKLDFMNRDTMLSAKNAYVTVENGKCVVVPETRGTVIDRVLFEKYVVDALTNMKPVLDLQESDCYLSAGVTADSKEIAGIVEELNNYLNMVVTYKIDEVTWSLTAETFGEWLYYNDGWHFNERYIREYVESIAEEYDTIGTERAFRTHAGDVIYQTGSRYGWALDIDGEIKELFQVLVQGESVERTPVFYQTGAAYNNYNDIGDSYVEVDLSNQHVYVYVDGTLAMDCDCVSGCVVDGHATPDGLYSISYKESPSVLTGEDYESHVTYWMPFNRGIGLHDATWRGSFGGSIYKNGGSHGCVNLPFDSAARIYDLVYAGMPVICYY